METKFKTVFATQIRAIEADETTRNEVKASLSQLRNLLPANINPEDEPALLFVAGNLFVANTANLNDDAISTETALATYKKFVWQQINLEHDRERKVGFIVHAGLSEFGTDRLITEEEARSAGKPFNVAVVMALWRVGSGGKLCAYIEEASSPTHPDFNALSLSLEVGFENYSIVALPKDTIDLSKAGIVVKPTDAAFGRYDGALRANKGSGLSPDDANQRIYRNIDDGVVPLGGGIVTMPAGAVKGLVTITETPSEPSEETSQAIEEERLRLEAEVAAERALEEAKNTLRIAAARIEQKVSSFLNLPKTRVSPNTPTNSFLMNHTELQAFKERLSKVTKIEDMAQVVASVDPIIDAIVKKSEELEKARKEAESHASEIEKAKAEALANVEKLGKEMEALRKELADIKSAQAAAAAEEAFQTRMRTIEATFDFADDERADIVADIKDLSDEAFAKWLDKSKKLMKEKTKDYKKKKADEAKAAQDALIAKLGEKNVKASFAAEGLVIEEVLASAQQNQSSSAAGSIEQPQNSGDLKELAKKAMGSVTFAGAKKTEAAK